MNTRYWKGRILRLGVLFALVSFLGLPSGCPAALAKVPRALVTFYFGAFHFYEYGQSSPITPDNIQRVYSPITITDPAVAHRLSGWLTARGGEAQFSPLMTRLRVDFAGGRPPIFVDDYGVVRDGASEYALPRSAFEHVSVTLGRIRKAHFDAIAAVREQARPALIRAAEQDDVRAVKRLLAAGVDVNARDNFPNIGATPLMSAAYNGDDALCRLLLAHGADVNAHGKDGLTALSWASMGGHPPIHGVWFGGTASRPHASTMRLLLARGARVRGKAGDYALDQAVYGGDASLVPELLKRGASLEARGYEGRTLLMTAIDRGHSRLAERLLAWGADVNAHDEEGVTPLFLAARVGDVRLATILLDRGVDVNTANEPGTALMIAVIKGHTAMVKRLLARGAGVSVEGDRGSRLLQEATSLGNLAITQMLVQAGAKKNE